MNLEVSEIAGIFIADGSLQKQHLCFWGNIYEDKDYYNTIIKRLFKKGFNITINPHEKKSNSVYGFYICNKKVIEFFNKVLGSNYGSKTYTARVPKVIMNSKNHKVWSVFIRGFSDCDGSLNFDKRYGQYRQILKVIHTYPRIQLKSVSHKLMKDISILLNRLEINHKTYTLKNKKNRQKDCSLIELKGKKALQEWMKKIGFNNPVQITRYKLFKKYGFVPPKTNICQRKSILKGEINPWIFYPQITKEAIQ